MAISRNWLISKTNYYADFVIVPLVIALTIAIAGFNILWFVAGLIIWSLMEYGIHRFLFHITLRNDHWLHHINEGGYVGISAYKTGSIILLLFLLSWLTSTLLLFQGVIFGYFLYIVIHDAIHHNNFITQLIPTLSHAHMRHHEVGDEKNFGVITMFWDKLFGTYKV